MSLSYLATVHFIPLEPLHFGSFGNFSPTLRGPAVYGRVQVIPSPTTVFGALARLLLQEREQQKYDIDYVYQKVKRKLGVDDLILRGPYLIVDNVPHVIVDDYVLSLDLADRRSRSILDYLKYTFLNVLGQEEEVEKLSEQLRSCRLRRMQFLGIGLLRKLKVADQRQGLLYVSEYVDYSVLGDKLRDVHICVDLLSNVKTALSIEQTIVRLGGEARMCYVKVSEDVASSLAGVVEKLIAKTKSDDKYILLVISPAVLELKTNKLTINLQELAHHIITDTEVKLEIVSIIGRAGKKDPIETIGLGYSEILNTRRPLKLCIPAGSMVIVKFGGAYNTSEIIRKLWIQGLGSGTLNNIKLTHVGFGTFIPIPYSVLDSECKKLLDEVEVVMTI